MAAKSAKTGLGALQDNVAAPVMNAGQQAFFAPQSAWVNDDASQANVGLNSVKSGGGISGKGNMKDPAGAAGRKFKAPAFSFGKKKDTGVQLDDDDDF